MKGTVVGAGILSACTSFQLRREGGCLWWPEPRSVVSCSVHPHTPVLLLSLTSYKSEKQREALLAGLGVGCPFPAGWSVWIFPRDKY